MRESNEALIPLEEKTRTSQERPWEATSQAERSI